MTLPSATWGFYLGAQGSCSKSLISQPGEEKEAGDTSYIHMGGTHQKTHTHHFLSDLISPNLIMCHTQAQGSLGSIPFSWATICTARLCSMEEGGGSYWRTMVPLDAAMDLG